MTILWHSTTLFSLGKVHPCTKGQHKACSAATNMKLKRSTSAHKEFQLKCIYNTDIISATLPLTGLNTPLLYLRLYRIQDVSCGVVRLFRRTLLIQIQIIANCLTLIHQKINIQVAGLKIQSITDSQFHRLSAQSFTPEKDAAMCF